MSLMLLSTCKNDSVHICSSCSHSHSKAPTSSYFVFSCRAGPL
uniref:Uncharacterized protein n=1 Tax=Anguilla anguilla TaxID=7936 RepID=A0A0E9UXR1_ANGAN